MVVENTVFTLSIILEGGKLCSGKATVLTVPQNTSYCNQVQGFKREDLLRA